MAQKDVLETEEYKGVKINIYSHDDPDSPREWDNIGTMVCWHRSYNLGDVQGKKEYGDPEDFLAKLAGVDYEDEESELSKLGGKELIDALLKEVEKTHLIMPLFLYDHSGISMSTSNAGYPFTCEWDSGQVGWIYVTHEKLIKEYGEDLEHALKAGADYLEGEVETYTTYLEGEVYGYMIEDDGDEFGGCWGFYGYDNEKSGLMEHARDEVDCYLKEKADKEMQEQNRKEKLASFINPFMNGTVWVIRDRDGELLGSCTEEVLAKEMEKDYGCVVEETAKLGK